MRAPSSKLIVAFLAALTVASGSWLLLAEPSLGRTRTARKGGAKAKRAVRPNSHGYGGYTGVCLLGTLRPLIAPESFIRRGKGRCFEGTGNSTGDNPDLSTEAFFATEDGTLINMTKDSRRCVEGSNNANPCTSDSACPGGRCEDTNVLACAADNRGSSVFFIFDGNPTGQNADLSDELFVFETREPELKQLTVQRGWCLDQPAQACDKSSDCAGSACARARMTGVRTFGGYYSSRAAGPGLEVSPDAGLVWFVTDGDPGGNPGHVVTQFVLDMQGNDKGLRAVGSAGKFCSSRTRHPGMPCTTALECGSVCGDGRLDPDEQCEPFRFPPTCPPGQTCRFPGLPDACTCAMTCGNGIVDFGEVCDGPFTCPPGLHCNATCTGCISSPSGAFLDSLS